MLLSAAGYGETPVIPLRSSTAKLFYAFLSNLVVLMTNRALDRAAAAVEWAAAAVERAGAAGGVAGETSTRSCSSWFETNCGLQVLLIGEIAKCNLVSRFFCNYSL